jgi:hypothetical protein
LSKWNYVGTNFDMFNGFGLAFAIDEKKINNNHYFMFGLIFSFFKITFTWIKEG